MFCGKCGLKLENNQLQCPRCGYPVPQSVSASGTVNPPVSEVPQPEQNPVPQPEPKPELPTELPSAKTAPKKSRGLLIAAIALVVLAVGAVGFLAGLLIYHNSDGYKISQAVTAVLDGKPDEAPDMIREVNSPEADAVRQFCEMEQQRKAFFDNYDKSTLQGFDAPVKVSYDKLSMAYNSFDAADKLPEQLRERYERYNSRVSDMNAVLSKLSTRTLTDAQRGVLAFGVRKRGANFTVSELSDVIDQSESPVMTLQSVVVNDDRYAAFAKNNDAAVVGAMGEFCQTAMDRLTQDKYDLENYQQHYNVNTAMLLYDRDEHYAASMGSLLSPLTSLSDAQSNAQKLYTAMCYAWAAYAYA